MLHFTLYRRAAPYCDCRNPRSWKVSGPGSARQSVACIKAWGCWACCARRPSTPTTTATACGRTPSTRWRRPPCARWIASRAPTARCTRSSRRTSSAGRRATRRPPAASSSATSRPTCPRSRAHRASGRGERARARGVLHRGARSPQGLTWLGRLYIRVGSQCLRRRTRSLTRRAAAASSSSSAHPPPPPPPPPPPEALVARARGSDDKTAWLPAGSVPVALWRSHWATLRSATAEAALARPATPAGSFHARLPVDPTSHHTNTCRRQSVSPG
eukprot:scaffold834_cov311-Prasinococcus_capsulatus_cf.AAC.7